MNNTNSDKFNLGQFNKQFQFNYEEEKTLQKEEDDEYLASLNQHTTKKNNTIEEIIKNTIDFYYLIYNKIINKENPLSLIFKSNSNLLSTALLLIVIGIFILTISSILQS